MADDYRIDIIIDTRGDQESSRRIDSMAQRIQNLRNRARELRRIVVDPNLTIRDRATRVLRMVRTDLRGLSTRAWSITLRARDLTGNTISRIKSNLLSLKGAATLAIAALGVGSVGKATLGAAMDFETQSVSMEHWFDGNKKKSQEFVSWLDKFAAKTPFEMEDLFPAGARAVGISEGDVSLAQRMVKLSADMAGLTPGKTVQDAMEALGDAQMGEFERMKEFNMKFSKEQMDAVGGFAGFLKQAEGKFAGGAEKLSATAKGRISTIIDFIKTQFRSAGQGMLEALSPRLAKISEWFDKNPKTVERWKSNLIRVGRDGFEKLLSWGEKAFSKLKTIIEDPGFQEADWGTKIGILLNELVNAISAWITGPGGKALVTLGAAMGKIMADALIEVFTGAMMEHPILRTAMMGYAGGRIAGPWGAAGGVVTSVGAEIPIQAAKAGERRAEAQMQQIREDNKVLEDFKAHPEKQRVEGGELKARDPGVFERMGDWWEGVGKHADGGFMTRPHLGLVAEAGPESIIPLSSRLRSRALNLWEKTGRVLGVAPHADGGLFGNIKKFLPNIPQGYENGAVLNVEPLRQEQSIANQAASLASEVLSSFTDLISGTMSSFGGTLAVDGYDSTIPISSQIDGRNPGIWQQAGQSSGATGGVGSVSVSGVDVDISVNGMDDDSLALSIGRKIVAEIKAAWENR